MSFSAISIIIAAVNNPGFVKTLSTSAHRTCQSDCGDRRVRTTDVAQRRYIKLTDSISIRASSAALSDVFAEPAWLAEHLNDPGVRVVEVDVSRAAYTQGHIPGAVLWNAYTDLHHADYSPLDRREFEELLSRSGLAPDATIVFYGYGPSLGFWLVKAYGHERALVLHDTREGWRDAGRPWPHPRSRASARRPVAHGRRRLQER